MKTMSQEQFEIETFKKQQDKNVRVDVLNIEGEARKLITETGDKILKILRNDLPSPKHAVAVLSLLQHYMDDVFGVSGDAIGVIQNNKNDLQN